MCARARPLVRGLEPVLLVGVDADTSLKTAESQVPEEHKMSHRGRGKVC